MIKNEFYYAKMRGKARDLILLTGDHQGLTVESFYEHAGKIIDFARERAVILHKENRRFVPDRFRESRVEYDLNQDTLRIHEYIQRRLEEDSSIGKVLI